MPTLSRRKRARILQSACVSFTAQKDGVDTPVVHTGAAYVVAVDWFVK